jgi:hypothetical protein
MRRELFQEWNWRKIWRWSLRVLVLKCFSWKTANIAQTAASAALPPEIHSFPDLLNTQIISSNDWVILVTLIVVQGLNKLQIFLGEKWFL